jgi:hypothetical protein
MPPTSASTPVAAQRSTGANIAPAGCERSSTIGLPFIARKSAPNRTPSAGAQRAPRAITAANTTPTTAKATMGGMNARKTKAIR